MFSKFAKFSINTIIKFSDLQYEKTIKSDAYRGRLYQKLSHHKNILKQLITCLWCFIQKTISFMATGQFLFCN